MGKFIDNKTIKYIVHEKVDNVKEIVESTLRISPFGKIGNRIYVVEYKNSSGETKFLEISGEQYDSVYEKLNKNE
jgi:hypothetical protein